MRDPLKPVHWVGDAPTSLHGNGASSFEQTTRDPSWVTCRLCLTLLSKEHLGGVFLYGDGQDWIARCSCGWEEEWKYEHEGAAALAQHQADPTKDLCPGCDFDQMAPHNGKGECRRPAAAKLVLDPSPFRNRYDGSRWADDGGDPDLLPLTPREEFEQDRTAYDHVLTQDPYPYIDSLSPSGRRYTEKDPQPRPPWSSIIFKPRYGYAQDETNYPTVTAET